MQKMKFRGFKLFHNHHGSAESMVRQIDEFPSFFTPSGDQPLFVDCGANIGVSVLEWKTRWPQSRVICFEPDPFAFAILQKNIDENDIPGVTCLLAPSKQRIRVERSRLAGDAKQEFPNLFIARELLDLDVPIGGHNFPAAISGVAGR